MRIWIIHQNAYAPSHSASTRHFELARELTRRGHEVLIVASSFYHKARAETRLEEGELWRNETIDGVRYLWLRTPPYEGNSVARLWNMLVFTYRAGRSAGLRNELPPDVVIGSSPHLFSPWAAMRWAKHFKKPFLLEIRDIWPAVPVEMGGMSRWHPLVILMAWLEKTYYRNAKRVISVLPFADRHIEKIAGRSDHVVWIPNGSPLDPVAEPEDRAAPLTFMYAGAHSMYSGLDVLLDAADILQQEGWSERLRIRLIGDGPEKSRLIDAAQQRGLDMISFEPPVPKSDVFGKLQEADAFLLVYKDAPLMKWGLCPNKLYDYLGAARPVVFGMATPNNPVRDANAGVTVKPQDSRALAEGIKQVAEMPYDKRVAMGRRGRAYVEKHHNFTTLAEKLEQVLLDVVQPSSSQQGARTETRIDSPRQPAQARSPEPTGEARSYQPVVIIGAPRSGTNMLRDVLTSLSGVGTWPCDEINYIWRHGNASHRDDELLPEHATQQVQSYVRRSFDTLARRGNLQWAVEKTCANSLRVGFVDRVLPDAKYVFLIRDGRDAASSSMQRWTAPLDLRYVLNKARYVPLGDLAYYGSRYALHRLSRLVSREARLPSWGPRFTGMAEMLANDTLAEVCAAQWAHCVTKAQQGLSGIADNRKIVLRYEDFVSRPAVELERLLAFLGIPATPEKRQAAVANVSASRVGQWRESIDEATQLRIADLFNSWPDRDGRELIEMSQAPPNRERKAA